MRRRHPNEMTCQAPRKRPHARSDAVHGARLGRAERPVQPTRRLLNDLEDVADGCKAVWCPRCGVASEYEYVESEARAA